MRPSTEIPSPSTDLRSGRPLRVWAATAVVLPPHPLLLVRRCRAARRRASARRTSARGCAAVRRGGRAAETRRRRGRPRSAAQGPSPDLPPPATDLPPPSTDLLSPSTVIDRLRKDLPARFPREPSTDLPRTLHGLFHWPSDSPVHWPSTDLRRPSIRCSSAPLIFSNLPSSPLISPDLRSSSAGLMTAWLSPASRCRCARGRSPPCSAPTAQAIASDCF